MRSDPPLNARNLLLILCMTLSPLLGACSAEPVDPDENDEGGSSGGSSSSGGGTSATGGQGDGGAREVGAPCIPYDEDFPNFSGYSPSEVSIEVRSPSCTSQICLTN